MLALILHASLFAWLISGLAIDQAQQVFGQRKDAYLFLVSIDGLRYDYLHSDRVAIPNLRRLMGQGML